MQLIQFLSMSSENRQNLKTLKFTDLNLAELNDLDFAEFCNALGECRSVQSLNLALSHLGELSVPRFAILGNALEQCHDLKQLNISANWLGALNELGFAAFCRALGQCHLIKVLFLSANNLGALSVASFEALGNTFGLCHDLIELDVSCNSLGRLGATDFSAFCRALGQCRGLLELDIASNDLCAAYHSSITDLIPSIMRRPTNRTILDMERMSALGSMLRQCRDLQILSMTNLLTAYDNHIDALDQTSFTALCRALRQCSNLRTICLKVDDSVRHDVTALYNAINQPRLESRAITTFFRLRQDTNMHEDVTSIIAKYCCDAREPVFCDIMASLDAASYPVPMIFTDTAIQRFSEAVSRQALSVARVTDSTAASTETITYNCSIL